MIQNIQSSSSVLISLKPLKNAKMFGSSNLEKILIEALEYKLLIICKRSSKLLIISPKKTEIVLR